MKTLLYNPIFINPQAYYVFPRLTRYLQPDNESTSEPANYIGTIEVKVIAYGDTTLKRTYTNTDSIDLSEFKNTWIRISLFTKVGSCVLGEWKIGNMESDLPYIDPEVLASLKAVVIVGNKTNNDSDRAIVKNLVDPDNPFVISNAAYKLNSGFGKYEVDFTTWKAASDKTMVDARSCKALFNDNRTYLAPLIMLNTNNTSDTHSFNVDVSFTDNVILQYFYVRNGIRTFISLKSGVNTVPLSENSTIPEGTSYNIGFAFYKTSSDYASITITQIPSFQGALVTDGINDLITSTKTVQEMLGGSNEITVVSMIHQVKDSSNNVSFTNYIRGSANGYFRNIVNNYDKTGIYGYTSSDLMGLSVVNNILGDKNDYTSNGDNRDSIINGNFSVQGYSYNDGNNTGDFSSVAWYWTIIANKVLTTDQINQVIAYFNLDRTLKPDILCDVKKQGITNDNHAEFGDKLIDFSGNGRDIQLNNIAWDGDSGIGKYNYPNWKVNVTRGNKYARIVYYDSINGTYSADFKGITDLYKSYGLSVEIRVNRANTIDYHSIKEDGIYTVTPPDDTTSIDIRFGGENVYNASCDITITQIPSHAGALCLDGVNDFGQFVGDLGLKDYTFIADRAYDRIVLEQAPFIASKSTNGKAPFLMEYLNSDNYVYPHSFGATTKTTNLNIQRQISYQSTYVYNGNSISKGTSVDTGNGLTIGNSGSTGEQYSPLCLWSLMLFPYSMSEFLIERQLKKHKLGTLYPDMVEFRPIVKSNVKWNIIEIWQGDKSLYRPAINYDKTGIYLKKDSTIDIYVKPKDADEVTKIVVNGTEYTNFKINSNGFYYVTLPITKSPQKINITVDEYIRYEDIVQPYPSFVKLENLDRTYTYTWGDKLKVGDTIRYNSSVNLLEGAYTLKGQLECNGVYVYDNNQYITVAKEMIFAWTNSPIWSIDDNEPKCILSPRLLRIPNSSYKILGYIPDISGHGNHGKINNSAYAEGSGVNEDGSYQFDGVDDFVTIPTTVGGKQVLMKVNWQSTAGTAILYDQRTNGGFAIFNKDFDTNENKVPAYRARNIGGSTYIDGILNKYIYASELKNITHNIVELHDPELNIGTLNPKIGSSYLNVSYAQMSLYDFMLFDEISTDDKIKELNEYVGVEAKVELPPYYWDTYGKTNSDADRDTIQQRGVAVGDYDLTNYNHAYEGMSGYNGYPIILSGNNRTYQDKASYANVVGDDKNVINFTRISFNTAAIFSYVKQNGELTSYNKDIESFKIKVTGIDYSRFVIKYSYISKANATAKTTMTIASDSIYELPKSFASDGSLTSSDVWIGINFTKQSNDIPDIIEDVNVTIEVLPKYENGLAYDGVEDYSDNKNIPIIDDFTVIAKRTWLEENISDKPFIIKGDTLYPDGNQNAFLFEYGKLSTYSFGQNNKYNESVVPSLISWATPTSYNGTTSLVRGSAIDTVGIDIAHATKMVLYKLILYPKTISLLEINFLKNLMEKDEIIDLTNPIFIQE